MTSVDLGPGLRWHRPASLLLGALTGLGFVIAASVTATTWWYERIFSPRLNGPED